MWTTHPPGARAETSVTTDALLGPGKLRDTAGDCFVIIAEVSDSFLSIKIQALIQKGIEKGIMSPDGESLCSAVQLSACMAPKHVRTLWGMGRGRRYPGKNQGRHQRWQGQGKRGWAHWGLSSGLVCFWLLVLHKSADLPDQA